MQKKKLPHPPPLPPPPSHPPPPPPTRTHTTTFWSVLGPKELMDFPCKKTMIHYHHLCHQLLPQTLPIFGMTPPNTTSCSFNKQAMWCMFIYRIYLNGEDFSSTLIEFCSGPGCLKRDQANPGLVSIFLIPVK